MEKTFLVSMFEFLDHGANFVLRYVRSRLFGKFVPIFVQL